MKNSIMFLLVLFFVTPFCYTQNEKVNLNLKWKVGDVKLLTVTENIKKYKDNKFESDSSLVHHNKIMVSNENDSVYLVIYQMENYLINPATTFYKNLESELSDNDKFVELKYRVNKTSLKAELLNPIELDSVINTSLNRIIRILEEKVPIVAKTAKSQLNKCYSENKDLELKSLELFPDLLQPYNKSLVVGDTLITADSLFNPMKIPKFKGILKTYVQNIEKLSNTVQIKIERIYDFEQMKLLLMEGLKKIELKPQKEKNLGDFMFESIANMLRSVHFVTTYSTIISHNLDSTWPSKMQRQIIIKIRSDKDEALKIKAGEESTIVDYTIDINN